MLTRLFMLALLLTVATAWRVQSKSKCPSVCLKFCPYGYERNDRGCEICTCRPPPGTLDECPPLCGDACPYGNERDENNCDTCLCRPIPTNRLDD